MLLTWFGQVFREARHHVKSLVIASLGCSLIAGGQAILFDTEKATAFADRTLGRFGHLLTSLMIETLAPGVAFGLGLMLLGALLLVIVIGRPMPNQEPPGATIDSAAPLSNLWRVVRGRIALAVILVLVSGLSLSQLQPGMASVFLWLAALVTSFLVTWSFDRIRGSGLGDPFSQRWEWSFVFALMTVDLILVAHDLTNLRWAGTPDESHFFVTAKEIADGRLRRFPLSQDGVFGKNPLLSSYYQAAFMKMFGLNIFGWRMSSVAALVMSLPFLYLLGREIWSRRAGIIAAVLFGSAQLAVGFSHLGYNNNQVYPVMFGSLGILAWSIRRRSLAGYYLAGAIAGLSFYTIYSARLTPLLAILLVWSFGRLSFKRANDEVMTLLLGFLVAALPLLNDPGGLVSRMLQYTPFEGGAQLTLFAGVSNPAPLMKFGNDWLLSFFYAQWSKCGWNFDWNPVVDPVTAVLAMLGFWLGCKAFMYRSFARLRFMMPAYLLSAFAVGALSPYSCPSLTRLMTLVPFTALFAGIALDQIMTRTAQLVTRQAVIGYGGAGVVVMAVAWNIAALHHSIYEAHYGYGTGTTSELIRLTKSLPDSSRLIYIQNAENDMYDVDYVLQEYDLAIQTTYFRPFRPEALMALQQISPPFAVVYDLKSQEEIQSVEEAIGQRFSEVRWHDSAPGKQWNLRYSSQPAGLIPAP